MTLKTSLLFISSCCVFLSGCQGQPAQSPRQPLPSSNKLIGGGCDGCALLYVGRPATINSVDTSAGWFEGGQKLLVTGTVFKPDGKTPAPNVILYYWHTDNKGYYSPTPQQVPQARLHGHIRGWIQTGQKGEYALYTSRPAPYPNRDLPAHIHTAIKEPTIDTEYYLDEFVFDDDPLLTGAKRKALENRGGSGILRILLSGDLQIAEHNIVLGLHIPNYPQAAQWKNQSGLQLGEASPSFTPFHAFGPDQGTKTCPVCKYGRYHGLLYFVGNKPNWPDIKAWLRFLEAESRQRGKYLKAYFVYGNQKGYDPAERQQELAQIGAELNLKNVALTFVPSLEDRESEVYLNKINPTVSSTLILYRQTTIIDKFIDYKPTATHFKSIQDLLNHTQSPYLDLPEPTHR